MAQAPVVDSVAIERESIAGEDEFGVAGDVTRALHITTRDFVVRREVLIKPGQPYDSALAYETERNLRALGAFRRVLLDTLRTADGRLVFRVRTQDGWTTYPLFDISSAAGQTSFTLGLEEGNFLGLAAQAEARYRSTPDRTSWLLTYRQPRAIANRVGVSAAWEERSDGRYLFGNVSQPFLTFSSTTAYGVDATNFDGDVLRFREGDPSPYVTLRRRLFLGRASFARALSASPRGYTRVGVQAQVRREDFLEQPVGDTPFSETWTGAVGPYVEWARARFVVVRNVRSFLREEDEPVGPSFRLGLLLAPEAFGYERNGAG
ncbi:MAG TPA: hypothetical protein VFX50_11860, partial [Gemmatimonadales bacterium]|nr:hypothetical protein [Gemmatimonadales bacterium]